MDIILKVSQISFYVVLAVIAILTYRSAKRGLLNTINTEYHKRILDKLEKLSEELYSEFDHESPTSWSNTIHKSFDAAVEKINNDYLTNPEVFKLGASSGTPLPISFLNLQFYVDRIKSDPFIPKTIRKAIIDFQQNRIDVMMEACREEFLEYQKELAKGMHIDSLDKNRSWIWNQFHARLKEKKCSFSSAQERANNIRLMIQEYLESFNPLDK